MAKVIHKGNFNKTERFFGKVLKEDYLKVLDKYGQDGVDALAAATPVDSGLTASSWYYEIESDKSGTRIVWKNRNVNQNENIAILLQYGHGTRTGGFVAGRDYINPALRPVFDRIAEAAWKEVVAS